MVILKFIILSKWDKISIISSTHGKTYITILKMLVYVLHNISL